MGGKARVRAPIPLVSPFIELGIGASVGSFKTSTEFDNIEGSGIINHIPWSIGLEIGRHSTFDISISYFEQPKAEQFAGAFAIGVEFPLKK